ncbi:hypothetical protein H4R99_002712 [Coemansia sp. RSA 1722]|nr:hypothetical protein LPJ57_001198 [Coemansia sp. RSA 486]KAJ2228162.1 hypothetical protein IWW45_006717 [Coemansia sp. RSA 485]KAJ2596716.1 hypothetical protein GGF39_003334 [Coemansia sp. RSA 1721]KAJ2602353.1 hypothetical protein H4R99_002712 [Coemansia sp. RSA 1722]KAJ2635490.1 hypothetical protein GGF40_003584 [Coemansia sp. RSA 1286]
MSTYTIYVPGHVDRSKIQSCLVDVHSTFVNVDIENFDINTKIKEHKHFIVLEKDHFVTFLKQHPQGVKCDYKSRNLIMSQMTYGDPFKECLGSPLEEENGIWTCQLLPVLYFVFRPDAQALAPNDATVSNTIAEFYDTVEEEDFENFAQIAKTKESCVPHFFVVNRKSDYYAVDTNNPSVSCKLNTAVKHHILANLTSKFMTIQDVIEEENNLYKRKPPTMRDPNFQLHDNQGVPLNRGETFVLEIYNSEIEDNDNENSDYEREIQYVEVFESPPGDFTLCGALRYGSTFGFKIVDGTTYLTYNNDGYVCISPDKDYPEIIVEPEIPPKERRVYIHYTDDGNIQLSQWNGDTYASCEWVKCACGVITIDSSEEAIRWGEFMKLVVKRV